MLLFGYERSLDKGIITPKKISLDRLHKCSSIMEIISSQSISSTTRNFEDLVGMNHCMKALSGL